MIDQFPLPPLSDFRECLYSSNTKKCLSYTLYFAKAQMTVRKVFQAPNKHKIPSEKIPIQAQRQQIFNTLSFIFTLDYKSLSINEDNEKQMQYFVISAQKIIMGIILIGHVHAFQLLISNIMPIFLNIVKGVHQYKQAQKKLAKKIIHFCRQTLTIMAAWFPKSFYDYKSPSWFKKVVDEEEIRCRFIIYYTNEKIFQYQSALKELKLNDTSQQCLQCLFCLNNIDMTDQDGLPALPSVILEQNSMIQSLSGQKNVQKINPSQLFIHSVKIQANNQNDYLAKKPKGSYVEQKQQDKISQKDLRLESYKKQQQSENRPKNRQQTIKNHDQDVSSITNKSKNSKISQRIRKHRQQRQQRKSNISNLSRLESQSIIQQQKKKPQISKQIEKNSYSEYFIGKQSKNSKNTKQFQKQNSSNSRILMKLQKYRSKRKIDEQTKSMKQLKIQHNFENTKKSGGNQLKNSIQNRDKYSQVDNQLKIKIKKNQKGITYAKKLKQKRQKYNSEKKLPIKNNQGTYRPQNIQKVNKFADSSKYATKNSIQISDNSIPKNDTPYFEKQHHKQSQSFHAQQPNKTQNRQIIYNNHIKSSKFLYQTIFHHKLYKSLLNISRNNFKKQCLKINKKRLFGESDKWILQIKTHVKDQYLLEVKYQVNGYQYKQHKFNQVLQPRNNSILVQEAKQYLLLSYQHRFQPIIMNICDTQVILPINIISMLKTLDLGIQQQQFKKQCCGKVKTNCVLDTSIFPNCQQIAHKLRLHKDANSKFHKRFYSFYSSILFLKIGEVSFQKSSSYVQSIQKYYSTEASNRVLNLQIQVHYMKEQVKNQAEALVQQIKKCIKKHDKENKIMGHTMAHIN